MDDTRASSPRDVSVEMTFEGRGSFSASGPDDLVFRALAEFRDEIKAAPAAPPPRASASPGKPSAAQAEPEPKATDDSMPPLKPFYERKKPKNNAEAVAVFTVWAKKKNGTDTFTPAAINDLWRTTSRKTPGSNLNRDINNAAKEGWLDSAGKGQYKVTGYGEEFVDRLPERKE